MSAPFQDDVKTLMAALRPANCLAVGEEAAVTLARSMSSSPGCHLRAVPDGAAVSNLPLSEHFDLALVADTLEHMTHRDGEIMLQKLRDLYTSRFLLVVPLEDHGDEQSAEPLGHWSRNDLLGFGLQQIHTYRRDDGLLGLFSFDIDRYKHTPDWLSPRYWANPELWDRYRW